MLIYFKLQSGIVRAPLRTKVRAPLRLVSQVWTKYKNEVPDVSSSNQNIETSCKNKQLTKLKDLCFKKKKNVHNSNSKTLKFQGKRYHFRLCVFTFNSEFLYCWH